MSRTYSNLTNKHPKVHFLQYLYNADEPHEYLSNSSPAELEAQMLDNSETIRQDFRRRARRIRSR
jgi:hypothetical protein